jgi:hypothetical protein
MMMEKIGMIFKKMKSTSEEIIKIAKVFLEKNNIEYISLDEPTYEVSQIVPNEPKINLWSVGYEYKVFDIESGYVEIEDETKKVLGVLTKHGRKYINGEAPEAVEDDGDDWSDL